MTKLDYHIFKSNTEAIATNRGFYYQYLVTLKLWLDNYIEDIDNEIYCEREDDILEYNSILKKYSYYQVKCYAEGFSLNSPEIKSSLLNFFRLFLNLKKTDTAEFYFKTNAFFKPRAGRSLKVWYENQQNGDFSSHKYISETRQILLEYIGSRKENYLKKETDTVKIQKAKIEYQNIKGEIQGSNLADFLNSIRWQFSGNKDTVDSVFEIVQQIKEILISDKLEYDKSISEDLLFGFLLNTIIEKTIEKEGKLRLLNNRLLNKIINSTNLQEEISEKLRPETLALMNNDFLILDKLGEVSNKLDKVSSDVKDLSKVIGSNSDEQRSLVSKLAKDVESWFRAIGYRFEDFKIVTDNECMFIINIPKRRGYDRIFVLCTIDVIDITHLRGIVKEVKSHSVDEGWVITYRRIDNSARNTANNNKYDNIFCYTVDELLDDSIDFSGYFEWLENEVVSKKIDSNFIPLSCKKDVFDREKNIKLDSSKYLIEQYIDLWLHDPAKKHISILGEFGTGKTWFTLNYAWKKLLEYKKTQEDGISRPRIPIVVPLRDFNKAVNIEGVFSEFFFKKHNSPIPTYDAFVELNKMGKLLLIFDGFDEMADKVDTQKMINNFWELARTITNNSKVILTCRNEHFPEAQKGRELLNAELTASTQHLVAETPQFEVLELLKFNEEQIEKLLNIHTTPQFIEKILSNKDLLELASRPIMIELILDSLFEIEDDKPIDISRIYLYAIRKKFNKDIKEERTFTSIPDKLYFMCEISWEMLSSDNMSLNYRLFPDRIRKIFNRTVLEQKDIDHWQYDMMGQTILIRNEEGDYKPAHRSFLEFFVAYKFAAELGVLDDDFCSLAKFSVNTSESIMEEIIWSEYFNNPTKNKMSNFGATEIKELKETFGKSVITRAILDLIKNMISINSNTTTDKFNAILEKCRNKNFTEIGYLATNIVILLSDNKKDYFKNRDLSNLTIKNIQFHSHKGKKWTPDDNKYGLFIGTNFTNSDLTDSDFGNPYLFQRKNVINYQGANFTNSTLKGFNFYPSQINSIALHSTQNIIAVGSPDSIAILNRDDLSVIKRIEDNGWHIEFSPDGNYLAHSHYGWLYLRDTKDYAVFIAHELSKQVNPEAQENGENLWTGGFSFTKDSKQIYVSCNNSFVYKFDIESKKEIAHFQCFEGADHVSLSEDQNYLVCSEFNAFSLWNIHNNTKIKYERTDKNNLDRYTSKFHPFENTLIITNENSLRFYDIEQNDFVFHVIIDNVNDFCFSADGKTVYAQSNYDIHIIDYYKKTISKTIPIEIIDIKSSHTHESIEHILINDEELNLYITTSKQVVVYNLTTEVIIDRFQLFDDLTGTKFIGTKGLEDDFLLRLKKNGAITKKNEA